MTVLLFATPLFAATERVLLPIYSPRVFGAFGSHFVTELFIGNSGSTPVTIRDLTIACVDCNPFVDVPFELAPGGQLQPGELFPTGKPGRFLILDGEEIDAVSMNLRVRDIAENATDYGVEIPVVRERDFLINQIVFHGVPTDSRFRNMLRIYSIAPVDVIVTVQKYLSSDPLPVRIRLNAGTNVFDPAYGVFTDFPRDIGPVDVRIVADPDFFSLLPVEIPLWAFISVTNNSTNTISTVTPQP